MSNYDRYTEAQRKAWGAKMRAAKAAKAKPPRGRRVKGYGDYQYPYPPQYYAPSPGITKAKAPRTKKSNKSIGQKVGGAIGAGIGLGAEQLVRWLTGLGDYEIKQNALLKEELPPMINKSNKGGTLIRHREYLGDIVTSSVAGQFNNTVYPLNPGLDTTFPWLSQIAANYEQYSLEGVIFEFRSMSADALNSTNTALGSVIMATEYDSLQPDFTNKAEMENHEFGASCKPSCDMLHPIECAPRQTTITELYTRSGANPSGSDIRLYDWGKFQIATTGFQGTSVNIGELHVTYQVRLLKARMFSSLGSFNGSYSSYTENGVSASVPLDDLNTNAIYDTIGMSIDPVGNTIGFPILSLPQTYYCTLLWQRNGGSASANVTFPTFSFTNCISYQLSPNNTKAPINGETASAMSVSFVVKTNSNVFPFVTLAGSPVLPGSTDNNACRLTVFQIDNSWKAQ